MAIYPRPDQPVIINASRALRFITDNFLRRYGVVSVNDTTLEVGTCKEVYQDEVASILSADASEEFKHFLNGYFMFATNKSIVIFEAGDINPDENTFKNEELPLKPTNPNFPSDLYEGSYQHAFFSLYSEKIRIQNISDEAILQVAESELSNNTPFEFTITNPPTANTDVAVSFEVVGINDNGESDPLLVEVNIIEAANNTNAEANPVGVGYSDIPIIPIKPAPVVAGVDVKKVAAAVNLIKEWCSEEEAMRCYGLALPKAFYLATADFANLVSAYEDINAARFFASAVGSKDPKNTIQWERMKNKKAFFGVFDNALESADYSILGVIFGVMASARFDYSDTTRGKPLAYQAINGVSVNDLKTTLMASLTDAPLNWAINIQNNALIANGRMSDGTSWNYYNQWDYARFSVQNGLVQLMLQATNVETPLTYDQTGVKMLEANIKATLQLMQSRGIIANFAQNYNINTKELEGIGQISIIDADTYRRQNEDDYNKGIYGGISFWVMIQNFIQQVLLKATIN